MEPGQYSHKPMRMQNDNNLPEKERTSADSMVMAVYRGHDYLRESFVRPYVTGAALGICAAKTAAVLPKLMKRKSGSRA